MDKSSDDSRQKLHASLALLPVDASQVDYLFNRLLKATPSELPVLRDALKTHRSTLTPKLWTVLESAKPGDASLLPAASALASYDPDNPRWESVGGKVAQALVSVNPVFLGAWLDALRPVRDKLTAPLATIFRDKNRSETERTLATNILTDYASDDPTCSPTCSWTPTPRRMRRSSPSPSGTQRKTLPLFQAEIAKKPTYSWNDPPLDPSWTTPDATLTAKIESAQGMLAERFAFCQTMPLDEFLTIAEALRPSGYRPTRFRPYAEGKSLRVAAVWTRDGRPWRMAHDQSTDEIRQTDERNRKEGYLPVDVAGYLAAGGDDGKPTSRFAALWAQRTGPDDDARMVVASSVAELTKLQEQLKNAGLVPLTLHAWRQADDKLSYSGVWHKTATGTSDTASFQNGLSEADLPGVVAQQAGSLIDLDLTAAPPPPSTKERAASALQAAEAALKAKPDDLNARFARAIRSLPAWREPESHRRPQCRDREGPADRRRLSVPCHRPRPAGSQGPGKGGSGAVPEGRLHREPEALPGRHRGGGTGRGNRPGVREAGSGPQETAPGFRPALRCRLCLRPGIQAVARKDQARSKSLSERALSLLRTAIQNGYADYKHMQEDADLDPSGNSRRSPRS